MDDAAFAELVKRYLPTVYGFIARYTGDADIAEDATQDTFVKAWRNLSRFDERKSVKPWLLAIARNSANDILRKRRTLPFSHLFGNDDDRDIDERFADDLPLPSEIFEQKELGEKVASALAKLSERDRAVLILRYEDELSFDEIGKVMKKPMNTVKSWHRRALSRLRKLLAESAPEPDDGA